MTPQHRIDGHPILPPLPEPEVRFTFNGSTLLARPGEVISSALYAAGISTFGHHHRDGGAQGIFCVNGQCSQCTVLVDGRPLKSCMTGVQQGMEVRSCDGLPTLPPDDAPVPLGRVGEHRARVLVLGGGPAGLCAAIELGRVGIETLVIDDKPALGGKLTLQTHQFFGSVAECWAGTRGVDIGRILAAEVQALPTVTVWVNATVVGVFADGKIGVVTPAGYRLVQAEALLVALGAREKSLVFPGCDLPGVYGAGAFQTLVNRDLVHASRRLFVLGGGNVGLIGAYHALQAGIDVVGLVEALPEVGGYKVHADKIRRLGVPVWTAHTVVRAEAAPGSERLGSVTIAAVDPRFQPVAGTERTFAVDTLLIAVGLSPCDELYATSRELGLRVYAAGDTAEIAEASAAIFSGRIVGRQMATDLGVPAAIPPDWPGMAAVLRSKPGPAAPLVLEDRPLAVFPVIRCVQEIPCNPCEAACPERLITLGGSIMGLPRYGDDHSRDTAGVCLGCGQCVTVCPGLAINLVYNDYDPSGQRALLMLPFELALERVPLGSEVQTVDMEGNAVGTGKVIAVRQRPEQDRRQLLLVEVPAQDKLRVAGFTVRGPSVPVDAAPRATAGDPGATAGAPGATAGSPGATAGAPGATAGTPGATAGAPGATAGARGAAAGAPGATAGEPIATADDPIVCRCERVRRSAIVAEIRAGVRDVNQLKALARVSMGGCGGKTCGELVRRLFREQGVPLEDVTSGTVRPLVAETPLAAFVRGGEEDGDG